MSASEVQGLHVLRVVQAARDVVLACEAVGGADKLTQRALCEPIRDLTTVVNALVQFERSAAAHGIQLPSCGQAAEEILAKSISLLSQSAAATARADAPVAPSTFSLDDEEKKDRWSI